MVVVAVVVGEAGEDEDEGEVGGRTCGDERDGEVLLVTELVVVVVVVVEEVEVEVEDEEDEEEEDGKTLERES